MFASGAGETTTGARNVAAACQYLNPASALEPSQAEPGARGPTPAWRHSRAGLTFEAHASAAARSSTAG